MARRPKRKRTKRRRLRVDILPDSRPDLDTEGGLYVNVSMARLMRVLVAQQREHHIKAIRAGEQASGGKQPPMSPGQQRRASRGDRNPERGMGEEGRFPEEIRSRSTRGQMQASGAIAAVRFFDPWQAREASRGVFYFSVEGEAEKITDAVLSDHLDWMFSA